MGVIFPNFNLPESQGVARPSSAPRSVGEALGLRQPQVIVEPVIGPLSNTRQPPATGSDGSQALLLPSPPAVPGGLYRTRHCDDVAVTESVSDDLEHWSGSDTAYGWGVPRIR